MLFKRLSFLLLVVLVAMVSCAQAEDPPKPEAEEQSPPGVTVLGREPIPGHHEQFYGGGGGGFIPTSGITYRYRYTYPYAGGFRYGWRYPIDYWNSYGRGIYGGDCLYGQAYGGFYYC